VPSWQVIWWALPFVFALKESVDFSKILVRHYSNQTPELRNH
jgi:hypothetical protein